MVISHEWTTNQSKKSHDIINHVMDKGMGWKGKESLDLTVWAMKQLHWCPKGDPDVLIFQAKINILKNSV